MKKIIFLLAASVFCFQFAGHSQTRVGLAGGVSISNMSGSESGGSSRAGFMGGIVLEKAIGKSNFSFRPSISYVQKGQTLTHPLGTLIDKTWLGLRYTEFNPDFLYYVGSASKGGFFIGAGPSISFNLPSKKVAETDGVKTTSTIHFGKDGGNDMRGTDWGANFTAGWRTPGGFFITGNYNHGFRNLVTEGNDGTLRNSYFGIQLGCYLNNK